MEMKYCMQCGTLLHVKQHATEGPVPYCDTCAAFRYPVFNTAVSMIVMDESRSRVILIRQYGRPHYVLVAGYVDRGEDAEDAVSREVREELGLTVDTLRFNRSRYYAPTNTLMLNYTVTVRENDPHPNWEVDGWRWFSVEEARENIKPGSLAAAFLKGYFDGYYEFPTYGGEDTR
ncbi:MAG: NUDIX domain-containing protein [Oscillospiraceae bacterium]|nr:NUDIX domain-containing protein [Oscillospiraceae bacterium]